MTDHDAMMQRALAKAREAADAGEVPVGAVIYTADGTVLAENHNKVEHNNDPMAHAELLVLYESLQRQGPYLNDCFLAVTLEPCAMCAQALAWCRIGEIRFGAYDPKSGGVENGARVLNHSHHKPTVYGGVLEKECSDVLKKFFAEKRSG